MPKIEYDDPNDISLRNKEKRKGRGIALVVTVMIISLLVGALGGIGGVLLLSSNGGSLAKKLGFTGNLSIPVTQTKNVIVEESGAFTSAVAKVSPSVVSITENGTTQDIFGNTISQSAAGTGFIITNDGMIITNKHVVADANAKYTVVLASGKSYDAKIQSIDPVEDLAVLKIDATNLPVVELGDSDALKVGQWVVAVGNALGQFDNTVTAGVISARNRQVQASDSSGSSSETINGVLQTDAAINPGNSGGPLVNLEGQVIGINTAVASNAQGIGFAIPINDAKSAIDSIKNTGKIVRPYLGVRYVQITQDIADQKKLPVNYGALIKSGNLVTEPAIVSGSPAEKAGLKENDIILEVNGTKIDQNNSLIQLIQQYKVGDTITLKVLSGSNQKDVKITLEAGQ